MGALRKWTLGPNFCLFKTLMGAGILRQSLRGPVRKVNLGKAGR